MFLCSLKTIDKDTGLRRAFSGGPGLVLLALLLDSPCHPSHISSTLRADLVGISSGRYPVPFKQRSRKRLGNGKLGQRLLEPAMR